MNYTHKCPACSGDGKETCNNPDHGFIGMVGGEIGRLGCPCCGHDENHKVRNGGSCEYCEGAGKVTELQCEDIMFILGIDEYITKYELDEPLNQQP